MTYIHSNVVRELESPNFDTATQRYIMIEISHLADRQGIIRYSQLDIANLLLLSRLTVLKELAKLENKHFLSKIKYGQYKVNILLEKQHSETVPAKISEPGPDEGKHKFELWCAKHSEELEQGTVILVSDEDTSPEAADYTEQGLIRLIDDEAILYKDGFYYIYERTD